MLGQQALGTPAAHDTQACAEAMEASRCDPRLVVLVQVVQHASYDEMTDALLAATNVIVLNQHPHDGTIDRELLRRVEVHASMPSPPCLESASTRCDHYRWSARVPVTSFLMPTGFLCSLCSRLASLGWQGVIIFDVMNPGWGKHAIWAALPAASKTDVSAKGHW